MKGRKKEPREREIENSNTKEIINYWRNQWEYIIQGQVKINKNVKEYRQIYYFQEIELHGEKNSIVIEIKIFDLNATAT